MLSAVNTIFCVFSVVCWALSYVTPLTISQTSPKVLTSQPCGGGVGREAKRAFRL